MISAYIISVSYYYYLNEDHSIIFLGEEKQKKKISIFWSLNVNSELFGITSERKQN